MTMGLVRKLGITGLLFLLVLTVTSGSVLHAQGNPPGASGQKRVLYINSFHKGYKFSDDETRGIESVLGVEGENVDLRIEYMDTKRYSSDAYLATLRDLYRFKYGNTQFDLVVASGDAALSFLLQYADVLFPNTPVVFCGASFFDESRLVDRPLFTGVSEEIDIKGTLDIALKLHPNTKRIVVVNDTSFTGRLIHYKVIDIIPEYPQVTISFLEDVTMDEVRQQVSKLSSGTLVLLTLFSRDRAGGFYESDVFTSLVAQSSAVPVYATWDYSLGYGVVGGKLTSGFTEGERAARIAQRVLHGEKPSAIPVVKQAESRYMFDYKQLQRFGINPSNLPPDSVLINRPFSFYETYKTLIWGVGISFLILSAIAVALFVSVLRRRQAEAKLSESNRELQGIRLSLEQRVEERTAALAQRAIQLQAAAEVAHATTSLLDPDALLRQVVDFVRERFNLYYVGLFLLDPEAKFAVLRAGTGQAGRQMLAQGHKLEVGGSSMIGQCVTRGEARIALDVGAEAVRFENPQLPDTRSEMALPLRSRGQVIGAMTVQSAKAAAFDEADLATMQTMADQVAVAIDNARLFTDAQAALQGLEVTQRRYMIQAWAEYIRGGAASGYEQTGAELSPLGDQVLSEVQWAASQPHRATKSGYEDAGPAQEPLALVAPILLRGRVIGALGFKDPEKGRQWSAEEIALAQAISEQFALAAENLRLLDETQRRAAREQLTGQVTARMRASLDMETVLQTALDEIQQAIGLDEVTIHLAMGEASATPSGNGRE
jgi:GAF domain-containing protein/ABC-type uncharacterized transport system substrate-binding protein